MTWSVRDLSDVDLLLEVGEDPVGWFAEHDPDAWGRLEDAGIAARVRDGLMLARARARLQVVQGEDPSVEWAGTDFGRVLAAIRRRQLREELAAARAADRLRARESETELRDREAQGRALAAVWSMWPGRYVPELDPSAPIEVGDLEAWMAAHGVDRSSWGGRLG